MTLRRMLLGTLSLALGTVLTISLIRLSKLDVHGTLILIQNAKPSAFAKLVLLNALLIFLSTEKWLKVDATLRHDTDAAPSRLLAFAMTSAGMALGLVLPVQLGMSAARTLGTSVYGKPLRRGTAGTLLEQSFDLLVVMFLAVASGVTWLCHGGAYLWGTTAGLMIILALFAAPRLVKGIRWAVAKLGKSLASGTWVGATARKLGFLESSSVFNSSLVRRLMLLSAVRFGVLVLMAVETGEAIGVRIPFWQLGATIPFAVFAMILAITPGGIGVNEVTSVGILTAFGTPLTVAAEWSVANRILIVASCFLVATTAVLVLTVRVTSKLGGMPGRPEKI